MSTSSIVVLLICAALIIYAVASYIYQQRIMKTLTEEEFRAGYRKAQLIDVREPNEYEGGHILGARNIPLSQLKQRKAKSGLTNRFTCTAKTTSEAEGPPKRSANTAVRRFTT